MAAPVTTNADVIVIGGGIAGLTTALAAADRGLHVSLLHVPSAGEASRAAAGMLAPSVEGMPDAVLSVALEARDRYPRFLDDLRDRSGVSVTLDRNGILELATSESDLASHAARAGTRAQTLDARALASLEPAFAGHAGAVLHAHDGAVDNVALMTALEIAVAREARITRHPARVRTIHAGVSPAIVRTEAGDTHAANRLVLATGAWAAGIDSLPRALPVRPLMGQLLRIEGRHIGHVTYGGGGYLIPRGESVVVGATSEENGFHCATSAEGHDALRDIARRAAPSLHSARTLGHWAGLRPMTPDTLPILGADPAQPSLLYSCGFSRNGILLAPWAAEQLAFVLTSEHPPASLALFSAARFGPSA